MPIYTYMCTICGIKDIHQSIFDLPLESCPQCGVTTFKKIISAPNISFKGSGFYSTDNRGK
jgi:putative FmdB family regulatory protein